MLVYVPGARYVVRLMLYEAWNPSTTSTTAEAGANLIVACVHMLLLQGLSRSFPSPAQLPAGLSLKPQSIPLKGAQIELYRAQV